VGLELRPTGARPKETPFDIIGTAIQNAALLDLFAGTGAIGVEALSRGAARVTFVESSERAEKLIRRNLTHCGIASGYRLLRGDAFKCLRRLGREGVQFDVVFMDPPYGWGPYGDLLQLVFSGGLAARSARVVIEHRRGAALPARGEGYRRVRTVRQGDQCLSFYATDAAEPEEDTDSAERQRR